MVSAIKYFITLSLLIGLLVAQEGCLRIESRDSEVSYVPIWPPGYELSFASGAIDVVDETGKARARVGEGIYMGGGEVHLLERIPAIDAQTKRALAERCSGPYWIVGAGTRLATNSD